MLGRERIVAEISYEAVVLRIAVDVADDVFQLLGRGDGYASEGLLEEAARPIVGNIDGLGIAGEKVGEAPAGRLRIRPLLLGLDSEEDVKVVRHQTVGEGVGHG